VVGWGGHGRARARPGHGVLAAGESIAIQWELVLEF